MGPAGAIIIVVYQRYLIKVEVNDCFQAERLRLGYIARAISAFSRRCRLQYGIRAAVALHGHDVLLDCRCFYRLLDVLLLVHTFATLGTFRFLRHNGRRHLAAGAGLPHS